MEDRLLSIEEVLERTGHPKYDNPDSARRQFNRLKHEQGLPVSYFLSDRTPRVTSWEFSAWLRNRRAEEIARTAKPVPDAETIKVERELRRRLQKAGKLDEVMNQ